MFSTCECVGWLSPPAGGSEITLQIQSDWTWTSKTAQTV